MKLHGRIKAGAITKSLVGFLKPGDIAVIQHEDIDELAAAALISTGVKVVINTANSMSGRFNAKGASMLLQGNIKVFDVSLPLYIFKDNDFLIIMDNDIIIRKHLYKNACTPVSRKYIMNKQSEAKDNESREALKFVNNTIIYAARETEKLLCFNDYPELDINLSGRHVIVVARNSNTPDEIASLKSYIEKHKPIFIGVDGGADLLVSCGYTPDILIGDMDSVSDIGIYKSREIILHAYENGFCPCLGRIEPMNVHYKILTIIGTSEDAALMLAYRKNAELIVLAGGHSCMQDFVSKGRQGMASTFITRTLIGSKLVDCRGLAVVAEGENEGNNELWAKM